MCAPPGPRPALHLLPLASAARGSGQAEPFFCPRPLFFCSSRFVQPRFSSRSASILSPSLRVLAPSFCSCFLALPSGIHTQHGRRARPILTVLHPPRLFRRPPAFVLCCDPGRWRQTQRAPPPHRGAPSVASHSPHLSLRRASVPSPFPPFLPSAPAGAPQPLLPPPSLSSDVMCLTITPVSRARTRGGPRGPCC